MTSTNVKGFNPSKEQQIILGLRLLTLVLLVVLLTCHIRSVRVFRWEQSVTGGLLVTYTVAMLGMAFEAVQQKGEKIFQAYICASGSVLLVVNALVIYQRWSRAGDLTLMVAELLGSLGVRLKRQVLTKIALSAAAGMILFMDLTVGAVLMYK